METPQSSPNRARLPSTSTPVSTPTRSGVTFSVPCTPSRTQSTPSRTTTMMTPTKGHSRLMSLAKVRSSLDDEQRARLLGDIGDDVNEKLSPLEPGATLNPGVAAASSTGRRKRPWTIAMAATSLILLICVGTWHAHPNVDSITQAVQQWMPASSPLADQVDMREPLPLPTLFPSATIPIDDPLIPLPASTVEDLPPSPPTTAVEQPAYPSSTPSQKADSFGLQSAPSTFPSFMAQDAFFDTRPHPRPIPAEASSERYLSFLPHSGFHNQRIEFENAVVLAQLLDRTLLVPAVRLGYPQGWQASPDLQLSLERDEKQTMVDCIQQLDILEQSNVPGHCENYTRYSLVTWDALVDLAPLETDVRLVERVDISRSWFTSPEGLGLTEDDIETFDDKSRYSLRFYDSKGTKDIAGGRYQRRIDIDDLLKPPMSTKRLLEFGSFFGSGRISLARPANRKLGRRADTQMVFRNPMLARISDEIVQRLGGRDNYVGLHLRVGDGAFRRLARQHMLEVFRRACTRVFKLDAATIDQLIKSSARSTHQRRPSIRRRALKNPAYALHDDFDPLAYLHEHDDVSALQRRAEPLQCKGELHTEEHLLALNRPIYIATDAHSPRTNADLTIFFNTFPCAFVLGDFVEVPELMALEAVRSLQEGVKMAPFLYPFLEAMMAAKSRIATIGTPSSTFSGFAAGTLHRIYAAEPDTTPVDSLPAEDEQGAADEEIS